MLIAAGHGRSYAIATRVLGRGLSSIDDCRLWKVLASKSPLPTTAVVTDVGNDVMYGVPTDTVLLHIRRCLERLQRHEARIVITRLPLAAVSRLKPWLYYPLRAAMFPGNSSSFADVLQQAKRLDEGLARLAEEFRAHLLEVQPQWYGFDSIHIRFDRAATAWREFTAAWADGVTTSDEVRVPWHRILAGAAWRPDERSLFGVVQRRAQPIITDVDGSSISLY